MNFLPIRSNGEKVYAGFWKRLWAALLDFIIIFLSCYIPLRFSLANRTIFALAWIPQIAVCIYVYLNARFGGTPGKLAVGIKITKPDGTSIGWVEAWKRSSVDLGLASILISLRVIAVLNIDPVQYSTTDYLDRMDLLKKYLPGWSSIVDNISAAWTWSELIVLLLNKRKRALHDFIAGTVVIHKKFAEQGTAPDRQETGPASR